MLGKIAQRLTAKEIHDLVKDDLERVEREIQLDSVASVETVTTIAALENWIAKNVTESVKESVQGDVASLSIELAERAITDAAKAGLSLTDLEPEFGTPETVIREALDASEGAPGE